MTDREAMQMALEALEANRILKSEWERICTALRERLEQPTIKESLQVEQPQQEPVATSPTAGMNIAQRILHVGGRNNAAGYVEFGSIQAVKALVYQVLRDITPQPVKQQEPVAKACANCWGTGVDVAGKPCPCGCKPYTAPQRRECEWYPEDDENMPGIWRSDCDVLWTFTDGGPVENEMRYCCGCGANLKERKA